MPDILAEPQYKACYGANNIQVRIRNNTSVAKYLSHSRLKLATKKILFIPTVYFTIVLAIACTAYAPYVPR